MRCDGTVKAGPAGGRQNGGKICHRQDAACLPVPSALLRFPPTLPPRVPRRGPGPGPACAAAAAYKPDKRSAMPHCLRARRRSGACYR